MAYASRRSTPVPERIEALPRRLVGRRPGTMQQSQASSAAMCAYAPAAGQNRCAMEIDGERVLVDVGTFTNLKNERAVVLRHDGNIGIELVSTEDNYPRPYGSRTAFGQSYKGNDGGTRRDGLTVIGKVIEPEIFHGVTIDGEAA